MRKLMVDAIIAGGNVTVPIGRTVGSTFKNLPLVHRIQEEWLHHCLLLLPF
jgi:hypothetical protein